MGEKKRKNNLMLGIMDQGLKAAGQREGSQDIGVGIGTPGGGWIRLSATGCVTHKHLWKLIHDFERKKNSLS
jgi:hypothetical protein